MEVDNNSPLTITYNLQSDGDDHEPPSTTTPNRLQGGGEGMVVEVPLSGNKG